MSKMARNTTAGKLKMAAKDSLDWFKNNVTQALKTKINPSRNQWAYRQFGHTATKEFKGAIRSVNAPMVGSMYFFIYDAKHKATLPYFDAFPLVFPISYTQNGFYGINFHYLPVQLRAKLMDSLLSLKGSTHDSAYGQKQYLRLSYQVLSSIGNTIYKPTIKRYLYSHVKSKFAEVDSEHWETALFMPVENFKNGSKSTVWKDSKGKI